jgi:mannosyltransferase OCH1-like enzyme
MKVAYGVEDVVGLVFKRNTILSDQIIHQILISAEKEAEAPRPARKLSQSLDSSQYRLWRTDEIREFIGEIYGIPTLHTFDCIKPFAYKADFARYCIINYFGGWYVDLMVEVISLPSEGNCELIAFRDRNHQSTSWNVQNAFFYSIKNSPILNSAIEDVKYNVRQRNIGKNPLFPTGPTVFGRAIAKASQNSVIMLGDLKWYRYGRSKYLFEDGSLLAKGKKNGQQHQLEVQGGNSYRRMWESRDIYED